jgi:hypothetical protein
MLFQKNFPTKIKKKNFLGIDKHNTKQKAGFRELLQKILSCLPFSNG